MWTSTNTHTTSKQLVKNTSLIFPENFDKTKFQILNLNSSLLSRDLKINSESRRKMVTTEWVCQRDWWNAQWRWFEI